MEKSPGPQRDEMPHQTHGICSRAFQQMHVRQEAFDNEMRQYPPDGRAGAERRVRKRNIGAPAQKCEMERKCPSRPENSLCDQTARRTE